MESKPNPFLVASLMNGGGDQTHTGPWVGATATATEAARGPG
jgi:hypothetical protein